MSINHTPFNYSDYELTIYVDDPELFDKYTVAAEKHLQNIMKPYFDSGFDMYVPETIISKPGQVVKIVSNIVCDMQNIKRGQRASRDIVYLHLDFMFILGLVSVKHLCDLPIK